MEKEFAVSLQATQTVSMPRYFSLHTTACMPRQQVEKLIAELRGDNKVKTIRAVSDPLEGKLLCEFEAPNRETVEAFLTTHRMQPELVIRAEREW